MTHKIGEGLCALLLSLWAGTAHADWLTATIENGPEIARFAVPDGAAWCVIWNHSVRGFAVSDCYENRGGTMVLRYAHLPDFAAGLDHIPGRGRQVSDGAGGYFIRDIDEAVPNNAYILRPGAGDVDHRLQVGDRIFSLSAVAARQRVTISLTRMHEE